MCLPNVGYRVRGQMGGCRNGTDAAIDSSQSYVEVEREGRNHAVSCRLLVRDFYVRHIDSTAHSGLAFLGGHSPKD